MQHHVNFSEDEKSQDTFIAIAEAPIIPEEKPNLNFLSGFNEETLREFTTLYHKSPQELDALIAEHRYIERAFLLWYCFANYYTCLLYISFPIATNGQGNETILNDLGIDASIPNYIDYSLFWPLIIVYIVWDIMFFSVSNEAVKSTLYYLHKQPWRETLMDYYHEARDQTRQFLASTAEACLYQAIKIPSNFTGIMSELVYVPLDYKSPFGISATAFTILFGNEYYRKSINLQFDKGVDFFKNPARKPWVFRERNMATWLQTTSQGLSAVGLNVFPLYYFLAVSSEKLLGIWFPLYLVMGTKFLQSMLTAYPASYHYYMDDHQDLLTLLHDKPAIQQEMQQYLESHHLENTEANQHKALLISQIKSTEAFKKNISEQHRLLLHYLFKNNLSSGLLVLLYSGLGLYGGYGIAQRLLPNMQEAAYLFLPFGSLLLAKLGYDAELERMLIHQQLKTERQIPDPEPYKTDWAANFINVAGNFISATSMIGTLQPLLGDSSPEITTCIVLLALQRMLNYISFSRDMVKESVRGFWDNVPPLKKYTGCFFKKPSEVQISPPEVREDKAVALHPS